MHAYGKGGEVGLDLDTTAHPMGGGKMLKPPPHTSGNRGGGGGGYPVRVVVGTPTAHPHHPPYPQKIPPRGINPGIFSLTRGGGGGVSIINQRGQYQTLHTQHPKGETPDQILAAWGRTP